MCKNHRDQPKSQERLRNLKVMFYAEALTLRECSVGSFSGKNFQKGETSFRVRHGCIY